MRLIEIEGIHNATVEKNGAVSLAFSAEDKKTYTLLIPADIASALHPTFARAQHIQQAQSREPDVVLVAEPQSIRVLLNTKLGKAFVRFDQGTLHEQNIAMDRTLLAGFLDQAGQCLQAMEQRGLN